MSSEWYTASAPGKFVVLGEHSVVYGKPAVVLATDRRITCSVRRSKKNSLNGEYLDLSKQPHFNYLTRNLNHCLDFLTVSEIPSGSGLGSSASLSAALALAIHSERGESLTELALVEEAYGAELFAQGNGSPMDASACVHGGGIAINTKDDSKELWTISRNDRTWKVTDIKVPKLSFVIGNTGVKAPTGPQVAKVRRFFDKNSFASDIIDEMGDTTLEGYDALKRGDVEELGRLMTNDHKLLSILGVSCKELNKLVNASLPYSYGAKLTGSGGGGCMVALTDEPEKVAEAIRSRGGTPYIMNSGSEGVRMETGIAQGEPMDIPMMR
ncbi:MAG: mevalonate kinase [Thermoplasmata archaeon]|nr:mevalonate kinase [Thermoplasmata archaeon]